MEGQPYRSMEQIREPEEPRNQLENQGTDSPKHA